MCVGFRVLRNNLKDFKSGNAELMRRDWGCRRAQKGGERETECLGLEGNLGVLKRVYRLWAVLTFAGI